MLKKHWASAAVAAAIIAGLLLLRPSADSVDKPVTHESSASAAYEAPALESLKQPASASTGLNATVESPMALTSVGKALSSDSPVDTALKAREAGGPAGFGTAAYLSLQCQRARGAIYRSDKPEYQSSGSGMDPTTNTPHDTQLQRSMAIQRLSARCAPFANYPDLERPRSGDRDGEAYARAEASLIDLRANNTEALKVLAAQGLLYTATLNLAQFGKLKDPQFSERDQRLIYLMALRLAEFWATSDPASRSADMRVLAGCAQTGICDGSFESILLRSLPHDAPQRRAILDLARKLEGPLRQNRVDAFMPQTGG